ncbi:MAG: ferredoxin [Frankiales bacterium]|nr:ferredoxin [Frankiales bacterium]
MKVWVDEAACQGHGRCYAFAPDVFEADDQGHSIVLKAEVTPEHEAGARAGAENCPERAITVTED